ncbi:MAG: CoA-binding protein [Pseudomonadales bacterium]
MSDIILLRKVLSENRIIAIVGLSDKPHRPSYLVGKYLKDHGFTVVPVNPTVDEILGEKSYASLEDLPMQIDMVDCFRRSEQMPDLARSAVAIGAKCLWMQLGVMNEEAKQIAQAQGLDVIMDRCTKIEYARLFGGP